MSTILCFTRNLRSCFWDLPATKILLCFNFPALVAAVNLLSNPLVQRVGKGPSASSGLTHLSIAVDLSTGLL